MSNKPKIYSFCKAGCQWETVHKDDFLKAATYIQMLIENNRCYLELGEQYKIVSQAKSCTLHYVYTTGGSEAIYNFTIPFNDEYADSFIFRLLEERINTEATTLTLVYEIAGVRYTEEISGTSLAIVENDCLYVYNADAVYLYNSEANYTVTPYTVFIRYATSISGENMSATYTGQNYLGMYVGLTASTNPADYTWQVLGEINADVEALQYAENERQKSKNLLTLRDDTLEVAGVSITHNSKDQTITFNGTATSLSENYIGFIEELNLLQGKTYTLSATVISGSGQKFLYLYNTGTGLFTNIFGTNLTARPETLTLDKNIKYNALRWYVESGWVFDNLVIKLQLEENNQATEWQYPYGAIVHEKDVPLPLKAQMICKLNSNQTTTQTGSNPILFDNITTIGNSGLITFSNGNFIFDNSVKYLRVYGTVQVAEITGTVAVDFNIAGLHFAGMDTSPNAPNTTNIVINTPLIENTGSAAPRLYIPDNTGEIQYWYTILVVEAY